eukprot:GDKI01045595.1.p4 GENE.GDKI01045595.1~~GDKI01045595.1.p4  ORF type:complete len:102 (-),score=21.57 GDKI01045595.1:383-688(-)
MFPTLHTITAWKRTYTHIHIHAHVSLPSWRSHPHTNAGAHAPQTRTRACINTHTQHITHACMSFMSHLSLSLYTLTHARTHAHKHNTHQCTVTGSPAIHLK